MLSVVERVIKERSWTCFYSFAFHLVTPVSPNPPQVKVKDTQKLFKVALSLSTSFLDASLLLC